MNPLQRPIGFVTYKVSKNSTLLLGVHISKALHGSLHTSTAQ